VDPHEELLRIAGELHGPCGELVHLHAQLTAAFRAQDLAAVRRLLPQIAQARHACAGLACGIAARLGEYVDELRGARSGRAH
jgi:hypothetical protein